jgi:hypothetical protein|tara:strand:- start:5776 stop:5922 length:147 start_codon:yes stop_codon:yes gene_type:complete
MIGRERLIHASVCLDAALAAHERGDEKNAMEYIKKCQDDLYFIIKCEA